MRSRPRTVIRSAAPGPAPMKWTVMVPVSCRIGRPGRKWRRGSRFGAGRAGSLSPAPARAAASASEPTPRRCSIRAERVTISASRAPPARRRGRDAVPGRTGPPPRGSPDPEARSAAVATAARLERAAPARARARSISPAISSASVSRRKPMPATRAPVTAWSRPTGSPAWRGASRASPDRARPLHAVAAQRSAVRRREGGEQRGLALEGHGVGATQRPPPPQRRQRRRQDPGSETPPPMNTASGAGQAGERAGAVPVTTARSGAPSAAALRRIRSARSGLPRSPWRAGSRGAASTRSRSSRRPHRHPRDAVPDAGAGPRGSEPGSRPW